MVDAAAGYEEALSALDKAPFPDGPDADIEPTEYRILCLFALKRTDQARIAIDTLLLSHPRYRPDPSLMSPGARAQFEAIRIDLIRRRYNEAKASFDAEDTRAALVRFDRVIEQLAGAGDPPALGDMRMLAIGYRDLAKVNNASPTPASVAPPTQPIGTVGIPPVGSPPMMSAAPAPAPNLTRSPLPPGVSRRALTERRAAGPARANPAAGAAGAACLGADSRALRDRHQRTRQGRIGRRAAIDQSAGRRARAERFAEVAVPARNARRQAGQVPEGHRN